MLCASRSRNVFPHPHAQEPKCLRAKAWEPANYCVCRVPMLSTSPRPWVRFSAGAVVMLSPCPPRCPLRHERERTNSLARWTVHLAPAQQVDALLPLLWVEACRRSGEIRAVEIWPFPSLTNLSTPVSEETCGPEDLVCTTNWHRCKFNSFRREGN